MAYTPPTTFADGTLLTSAEVEGNADALRVYLHRGIAAGDFEASPWIETRHVQPPVYEAFRGVQHGVTGHQGGQWAGGADVRLAFATKYLSGVGRPESSMVHDFQQAAFTVECRRDAKALYHYWWEVENGADESTAPYQVAVADRGVFVMPYFGTLDDAVGSYRSRAQETRNQAFLMGAGYPIGNTDTYVQGGGYGAKQGTLMQDIANVGTFTFGLAVHSLSDRCGVVNWGVAIEVFYL